MARKRKNQTKDNYIAARLLGGSMMAVVLIVFGFVLGNMFGQKDGHDTTTARAQSPLGKATQPRPSIGAARPVNRSGEPKYSFYDELQKRSNEVRLAPPPPPLPVPEAVSLRPVKTQPETVTKTKPTKKTAAEKLTEAPAAKPAAAGKVAKTLTEPAKPVKKTAAERLTAPPEPGGKATAKADSKSGKTDTAAKTDAKPAKAEPAAKIAKTENKQPANSRLTAPPEPVGKTSAKTDGKPVAKDSKETATNSKDKDAKKAQPVTGKRTNYRIQVGAFKNKAQAEQLRAKMAQRGLPVDIRPPSDSNKLYLVQIGPYASESQATNIQAKLKADGQAAQLKTFNSGTDGK
ncbi:SPOR domain-containing protein [Cardiobacterium sp. Marseille-Q4385]|uniref:SPOR domain-containing protein n=1 Tax=Cardiobacterium sp. Marseille-Q4385 TaxID=2866573 RepID=UPI001CE3CDC9|nr:SPOR domain-containing protein [Cardiobacterium sp. Marseille-Q4385]